MTGNLDVARERAEEREVGSDLSFEKQAFARGAADSQGIN